MHSMGTLSGDKVLVLQHLMATSNWRKTNATQIMKHEHSTLVLWVYGKL